MEIVPVSHKSMEGVEKIEQAGVDGFDISCAKVPENSVDVRKGCQVIATLGPVYGPEALAGMEIVK